MDKKDGRENAVYKRNAKTISGSLLDEIVMMDLEHGKYFSLNPVATRIWQLLETPADVETLCSRLIEEYDVEKGRCLTEVNEYLLDMLRLGLVYEIKQQQ